MKKIVVLIPSYKRPEVLSLTLRGLFDNTVQGNDYDVSIAVGVNKVSQEDALVISRYNALFESMGIPFHSVLYKNNTGKAAALNSLHRIYALESDYVVTLDNDMVISMPWMHRVGLCDRIDYDIIGFSSARFWVHDPIRERCPSTKVGDLLFYAPYSVAGGMMLFHNQFLKKNEWTNFGGVYGRDDADMCLRTKKKYVLYSDEDWLAHDPLNSSTPALKEYENKKKALYKNGITVFPDGWDE